MYLCLFFHIELKLPTKLVNEGDPKVKGTVVPQPQMTWDVRISHTRHSSTAYGAYGFIDHPGLFPVIIILVCVILFSLFCSLVTNWDRLRRKGQLVQCTLGHNLKANGGIRTMWCISDCWLCWQVWQGLVNILQLQNFVSCWIKSY